MHVCEPPNISLSLCDLFESVYRRPRGHLVDTWRYVTRDEHVRAWAALGVTVCVWLLRRAGGTRAKSKKNKTAFLRSTIMTKTPRARGVVRYGDHAHVIRVSCHVICVPVWYRLHVETRQGDTSCGLRADTCNVYYTSRSADTCTPLVPLTTCTGSDIICVPVLVRSLTPRW